MARISFDSLAPPVHFRFRLVHLFYATALLASAFAVFGVWGVLVGGFVLGFWTPVFMSARRHHTLLLASVVVFGGILPVCMCLLPAVSTAERAARRVKCSNNLRQIALALDAYHTAWSEFPPAYVADQEGRPAHSWRVLILPYMGHQALYARYDFNEPWNGPNNSKLLSAMPSEYACPTQVPSTGAGPQCTSYVAVVGEGTLWPGAASGKLSDIKSTTKAGTIQSGPSNTILLLEDSTPRIAWTEPRDWSFDEAITELSSSDARNRGPHTWEDYFYEYSGGRHSAVADGSVQFYSDTTSPFVWFELIAIDGREVPAHLHDAPREVRSKTMKVGNWLRLATFLVLLLLPLPWVWLNPTSSGAGKRRDIANDSDNPPADGSPS